MANYYYKSFLGFVTIRPMSYYYLLSKIHLLSYHNHFEILFVQCQVLTTLQDTDDKTQQITSVIRSLFDLLHPDPSDQSSASSSSCSANGSDHTVSASYVNIVRFVFIDFLFTPCLTRIISYFKVLILFKFLHTYRYTIGSIHIN